MVAHVPSALLGFPRNSPSRSDHWSRGCPSSLPPPCPLPPVHFHPPPLGVPSPPRVHERIHHHPFEQQIVDVPLRLDAQYPPLRPRHPPEVLPQLVDRFPLRQIRAARGRAPQPLLRLLKALQLQLPSRSVFGLQEFPVGV